MATLTDDVKKMHLCFLLVTTTSELGVKLRVKGDSLTFDQLKAELTAETVSHPYPPGFLDANRDIIEKFLGTSADANTHRSALAVIQGHFKFMGGGRDLEWSTEPCPRDEEREELQGHLLG